MTDASPAISTRHRTASLIMLSLDVVALLVLLFCFTIGVNKFRLIFDDLCEGRSLPALTRFFLSIPTAVSVVVLMGAIVGLVYKESQVTNKTKTLVINNVLFAAAVIVFLVLCIAMFLPLESFIGELGEVKS